MLRIWGQLLVPQTAFESYNSLNHISPWDRTTGCPWMLIWMHAIFITRNVYHNSPELNYKCNVKKIKPTIPYYPIHYKLAQILNSQVFMLFYSHNFSTKRSTVTLILLIGTSSFIQNYSTTRLEFQKKTDAFRKVPRLKYTRHFYKCVKYSRFSLIELKWKQTISNWRSRYSQRHIWMPWSTQSISLF